MLSELNGDVVKLVDTLVLEASAERFIGSSPIIPTIFCHHSIMGLFIFGIDETQDRNLLVAPLLRAGLVE